MFSIYRADLKIVYNLFRLNVRDRYLGSRFGMLWSLINPLLLLSIYIFVFGFVFKAKMPGSEQSIAYVIWLISGYAPWLAISDGIVGATSSVVSGTTLVKNFTFKAELLPFAATLTGIFPMVIGLLVLIILLFVEGSGISWQILWLIIIIPLQMLFLVGLGYFLAALNVFIRDISQMITSVLMLLLFFTPIFYPLELMPAIIQKVTLYNPFYQLIQSFRLVLVDKQTPSAFGIIYLIIVTIFLWYFGLKFFRKLKGSFESCL